MKTCIKCMTDKEESEFYKRAKSDKLWGTCKECYRQSQKERKFVKPETYKDYLQQAGMTEYYKKSLKYQV